MQQAKKPFRTRFQLLLRLTLNAGKHPANQPARLAQFDDGNDCAILVQGDEGPAQVVQLGHRGHSVSYLPATMLPSPRRLPHTISPLEEARFEPSVPLWLGAFTRSKKSMSGPVGVGGFEEGEFEGDGPLEKVAAQILLRGADAVQLRA